MNFDIAFTSSIWIFLISVILLWIFSNKLSKVVNFIDDEFKLGSSFGGTIILSLVTNLPEIAITANSAFKGNLDLAVGNLLGGIVIQSMLLVLFDFASRKEKKPLSTLVSNKTSIIQGLFLVIILTFVILGKQLNESALLFRSTIPEVLITITWLLSIIFLRKIEFKEAKNLPSTKAKNESYTRRSAIMWLISISAIILVFGILLEVTSDSIASHYNINGMIFGATILALVTSLPEISGGLEFVKQKTYQPIISDIFGGNAFLPVLFLMASIITNDSILPRAHKMDIYLTSIAIIITLVFTIGMIIKSPSRKKGLGIESWILIAIYVFSLMGMFMIS